MEKLYNYCTDFIINVANLLGLSYYEVNAFVFCLLYPLLIFVLVSIFIFQKRKLKQLRLESMSCIFIVISLSFLSSCSNSATTVSTSSSSIQNNLNTRSPIYTSIDKGHTWVDFRNDLPQHLEVNCIHRLGLELIIGTEKNGLFVSQKDKNSWNSISENIPSKKIKDVEVVDNQNIMVVFPNGIFTSLDMGKSWLDMSYNLKEENVMDVLLFDEQIFAGADYGIYELKNKKWQQVHQSGQVNCLRKIRKKLFAGSVEGVLSSDDGGLNWNLVLEEGTVHNIAIVDGKIVAMHVSGEVYISDDFGASWNQFNYFPQKGSYVYETVGVNDTWIMSNNQGIHQSNDNGNFWQLVYPKSNEFFSDLLEQNDMIYGVTKPIH